MKIWHRLERLEEAGGKHPPMIWRNHYETPEEAKVRWCTENGEDPAAEVVVIGWLDPQPNLPDQPRTAFAGGDHGSQHRR